MDEQRDLSRRERQIMAIVYTRGEASATDVWQGLSDRPSHTAVRTLLRILEDKGHLVHEKQGRQYIYRPVRARQRVGQSALQGVLQTFFGGSLEKALAAHLADPDSQLSADELTRLVDLIEETRKREA